MPGRKISDIKDFKHSDVHSELYTISAHCGGKKSNGDFCQNKVSANNWKRIDSLIESLKDLTIEEVKASPSLDEIAKLWLCATFSERHGSQSESVLAKLKHDLSALKERPVLGGEKTERKESAETESSPAGVWKRYQAFWYNAETTKRSERAASTPAGQVPWPVASGFVEDVTEKGVIKFFGFIDKTYSDKKALAVLQLEVARWDKREFAECFGTLEKGMYAGAVRTVRNVLRGMMLESEVKREN